MAPKPPDVRRPPAEPWSSSYRPYYPSLRGVRGAPYRAIALSRSGEDAAGALRAHAAVVHDDGAVDEDVGNSRRIAMGVGVRGLVLDGAGVQHGEVGEVAGLHEASLAQADAGGGHAGHLVDGRLQREELAVARVLAEHAGEGAVGARVRLAGPIALALEE